MPADKWEFIAQNASEIKAHFHNLWRESASPWISI